MMPCGSPLIGSIVNSNLVVSGLFSISFSASSSSCPRALEQKELEPNDSDSLATWVHGILLCNNNSGPALTGAACIVAIFATTTTIRVVVAAVVVCCQ